MKNGITAVLLSFFAIIGGIVLNFQEFLMGNPANEKNLIVTIVYVAIWMIIMFLGYSMKSSKLMMYCSVYWTATLIFSILTIYINATEATVNWAIPFVILFIGQWYGVMCFIDNFLNASILITSISFVFLGAAIFLQWHMKRTDIHISQL